jgi:hypothetical protein
MKQPRAIRNLNPHSAFAYTIRENRRRDSKNVVPLHRMQNFLMGAIARRWGSEPTARSSGCAAT